MVKKVFIVKGSPRIHGNTSMMAEQFKKGALEKGHQVSEVNLKEKNIYDCLGCGACQLNEGKCIQKDDMISLYDQLLEAAVIVFVSPVYFYTWTSLMKRFVDRTFAVESILKNKCFYLLSAGAAPEEKYMQTMIDSFEQYVSCFRAGGNKVGKIVFAYGTNKPQDVKNMKVLEEVYELGKAV